MYIYTRPPGTRTPRLTTAPATTTTQAVPNVTQFICKPPLYRGGSYTPFMEGIRYLKSRYTDTPPTFEPHTNNGRCTRVSCSYGAGIYVCNDNDCAVQVPILTIANYAEAIARQEGCDFFQGPGQASGFRTHLVWGQAFDRNGWLVFFSFLFPSSICFTSSFFSLICVSE